MSVRWEINRWYAEVNRSVIVPVAGIMVITITLLDYLLPGSLGLGFLYLIPILLAGGFLSKTQVLAVAIACSVLREAFGAFPPGPESVPRMLLVTIGFLATGLFSRETVRNRRLIDRHMRQLQSEINLRQDTEEQLQVLVDSTPAAILIADPDGVILMANEAARNIFEVRNTPLTGRRMWDFMPVLEYLRGAGARQQTVRTQLETRATRATGEVFVAHTWLSVFRTSAGPRIAAIIVDGSEELREREEAELRHLLLSSSALVSAVSHEVRNLCAAMSTIHANLSRVQSVAANEDFRALGTLIDGLRTLASSELRQIPEEMERGVDVYEFLDDVRIVVGPLFRGEGLTFSCRADPGLPRVRGEYPGLLQISLNLAQNSYRATSGQAQRSFEINVRQNEGVVQLEFNDNGPGVTHPESLFQAFDRHSNSTGMGLYISRVLARAYGGDLRYECRALGAVFILELSPLPESSSA